MILSRWSAIPIAIGTKPSGITFPAQSRHDAKIILRPRNSSVNARLQKRASDLSMGNHGPFNYDSVPVVGDSDRHRNETIRGNLSHAKSQ